MKTIPRCTYCSNPKTTPQERFKHRKAGCRRPTEERGPTKASEEDRKKMRAERNRRYRAKNPPVSTKTSSASTKASSAPPEKARAGPSPPKPKRTTFVYIKTPDYKILPKYEREGIEEQCYRCLQREQYRHWVDDPHSRWCHRSGFESQETWQNTNCHDPKGY